MDVQDQPKTSPAPTGQESHGVHLCRKCGWSFPNPHPSAKLRRAHKKICGTIQGYSKNADSEDHSPLVVSDDENLSDELHFEGPKIGIKWIKEMGSDGVGDRSNKSEDEVFSDAVTEFLDTGVSPGSGERFEDANMKILGEEEVVKGDLNNNKLLKVDATTATIHPQKDPSETTDMCNSEILDKPNNSSRTSTQFLDMASVGTIDSTVNSASDIRIEKLADGLFGVSSSICGSSPTKLETLSDEEKDSVNGNVGNSGVQLMMSRVQESEQNGHKDITSNKSLSDVVAGIASESASGAASEMGCNLPDTDAKSSDYEVAVGIVESNELQSYGLGNKMSEHDLSPEVESVEDAMAFAQNAQFEADSAHVLEVSGTEGEKNEDVHVVLVDNILSVVNHPEIMLEGYKDHEAMESSPTPTPDFDEEIRCEEDDFVVLTNLEGQSSFYSTNSGEKISTSSIDINFEDKKEKLPDGGEANSFEIEVISGQDLYFNAVGTNTSEAEATSGENLASSAIEAKIHDAKDTSFGSLGSSGISETLDTIEEKLLANNKVPLESAGNVSQSEVNQPTGLHGHDDKGDPDEAGVDFSNVTGNVSTELAAEEECASEAGAVLESCFCQPQLVDVVARNSQEPESTHLERISDSSDGGIDLTGLAIISNTRFPLQTQQDDYSKEAVSAGTKSNHNREDDALQTSSENPNSKEPEPISIDSEFSIRGYVINDEVHSREGYRGVSVSSEALQDEGDGRLSKQPSDVPAVDTSSQTDSLEGNWGSVSVLSTQSEAPAALESEALKSVGTQAQGESAIFSLQNSKPAYTGCDTDKSDVFEPPSFMTLVEPGHESDQKALVPELQTVVNTKHPNSEVWFPSITNVVNESQGRKKNEEIIAKVTNWSTGKPRTPLKSLLSEANLETKPKSPKQKQNQDVLQDGGLAAKDKGALAATANTVLDPELPSDQAAKTDTRKEWNSPERYPTEDSKKEKRKVKGKPHWMPFICCSSVS